tara:strand:+ start:302 stop:580 length:279 start_codon:yes stop_codon:yes gene_type:complete
MMPSFSLVENEELSNERYLSNIDPSQLPKISVDDPAILSLREETGFSAMQLDGKVVKFLRRSLKAGISPFYRQIVNTSISKDSRIWTWETSL